MGKYLFYDVDGTLVGKSQRITTLNAEALHTARKNGHKAFLCTGRAYLGVMRGLDGLEVDGMISHAGSVVNIGSKIIYEHDIDLSLLRRVRDLFEAHHMEYTLESKGGNFHTPGLQRFYLNWIDEFWSSASSEQ